MVLKSFASNNRSKYIDIFGKNCYDSLTYPLQISSCIFIIKLLIDMIVVWHPSDWQGHRDRQSQRRDCHIVQPSPGKASRVSQQTTSCGPMVWAMIGVPAPTLYLGLSSQSIIHQFCLFTGLDRWTWWTINTIHVDERKSYSKRELQQERVTARESYSKRERERERGGGEREREREREQF